MGCCCTSKCWAITSFIVGGILIIIGGISVKVFNDLFAQIIVQESLIEPGTSMYDAWKVVTTPTYMSYYIYNVTNADAILNQTPGNNVKPVLQELGPYTFREYLEKDNIDFLENTDPEQVFYRQTTVFVWDQENSVGSYNDEITTLNLIAASIVPVVEHLYATQGQEVPTSIYRSMNLLYRSTGTELLFTHTVYDLLFGFQDDLFDQILDLVGNAAGIDVSEVADFGLFSTANSSAGWFDYQVYTGKGATDKTNMITTYRNMTELTYWGTEYCNMLNGTDGTSTPPFMSKDEKVFFFVDDICRSLYSVYESEVTIKNVPGWKFSVPAEIFESPSTNSENMCYCPDPDLVFCNHDGGMSIAPCMAGAPVFVSSPHFLYGDGFYFNQTEGISPPVKEIHESALVFEPNTGAAIKADKRLQINILLIPNEQIDVLSIFDDSIAFPILWLNESGTVGQSDADLLYGLLVVPAEVVYILRIVLCIVGSIMFLVGPVYYCINKDSGGKSKNTDVDLKSAEVYQNENIQRYSSSAHADTVGSKKL